MQIDSLQYELLSNTSSILQILLFKSLQYLTQFTTILDFHQFYYTENDHVSITGA